MRSATPPTIYALRSTNRSARSPAAAETRCWPGIEARRNELLTPAGSKPKGRFAEALRQQTLLGDALAELDSRIAAYRDKVDQLAALRSEHVAAEQDLPWLSYREQQRQASEKLAELKRVEDELASERQREAQADTRIRLLREQLEGFASQARAVAERRAALEAAKQAQSLAAERLTQAAAARASALAKHEAAREALRVARQHDLRQQREREHEALETRLAACGETLAQAEELHRGLLELRRKAAASEIGTEDLETLRQQRDALRELEIRRQGAATGLRYQLADGHHIQLDDEALSGAGERRLLEVSTITLPGVGELEISPGGADLPQLQRERLAIADRHEALLRQLGLPSLAAAQTRHGRHAELLGDIRTAEATLSALAPTGMETLRGEIASLKARAEEVRRILDEFPAETAGGQPIPVSVAEADEAAASARLTTTSESHQGVQLEAGSAQASCEAAKRELDDAQHILDVPDRARRLADAERELTDAIADRSALAQRIEELNKRLSDSRPELLEQDVERFRMSAEQHERGHAERGVALARLDAELQAAGAQGLDEQRAEMARDLAAASRHATELDRLARALDYLVTLMREKRNALTRKLQAPLQKYLDHYLRILLPDARLEIDEDLRPGALTRAGAHGAERGGFESLSFGAREQMGVISRLAYADLLREAGRPTLIILDDALVHSDAQRLAQMKRVLFDAASRHQILLFSCHPEKWADLGVAARPLSSLPTVPRE